MNTKHVDMSNFKQCGWPHFSTGDFEDGGLTGLSGPPGVVGYAQGLGGTVFRSIKEECGTAMVHVRRPAPTFIEANPATLRLLTGYRVAGQRAPDARCGVIAAIMEQIHYVAREYGDYNVIASVGEHARESSGSFHEALASGEFNPELSPLWQEAGGAPGLAASCGCLEMPRVPKVPS